MVGWEQSRDHGLAWLQVAGWEVEAPVLVTRALPPAEQHRCAAHQHGVDINDNREAARGRCEPRHRDRELLCGRAHVPQLNTPHPVTSNGKACGLTGNSWAQLRMSKERGPGMTWQ